MGRLTDYIVDAVRRPREQLTRGQANVRYTWELAAHCWRQLLRHRAEGMAAELTYRTIFSLIPVVVLGLVMFRVVGGLDDVQAKVENQLYSFFGVPEIPEEYLTPRQFDDDTVPGSAESENLATEADLVDGEQATVDSPDSKSNVDSKSGSQPEQQPAGNDTDLSPPANGASEDATQNDDQSDKPDTDDSPQLETDQESAAALLADDGVSEPPTLAIELSEEEALIAQRAEARRQTRASIRRTLHEATSKVASIDFASIGVFGLLLFVYAAVALADSTEYLFNRIYEAPKHRPIHIRLAIHWSIITLGSGLLAMSLYMSGQFVDWAGTVGADTGIQHFLTRFLSVGASWVLLFLLYALMPNTNVSPKAAAIGALVGSLLWEGAKFGFQVYVSLAVPYSALYGSLGLIPLFLFWIYVTWLIVLFGLILTYTLQSLRGRRLVRRLSNTEDLLHGDPDWMLPIMTEVAHAFKSGKSVDHQELADQLGLSGSIVHEMTVRLVESGMLRRVSTGAGEEDSLTLAMPAEMITVADILTLAHQSRPTSEHPAWQTLASLKQAEREAAKDKTLAQLT